jgi:pilus assembly protein Flp/PilA
MKSLEALMKDDEGATAVEYALIAAAIAAVVAVVVIAIGQKTNSAFEPVNANLPAN